MRIECMSSLFSLQEPEIQGVEYKRNKEQTMLLIVIKLPS